MTRCVPVTAAATCSFLPCSATMTAAMARLAATGSSGPTTSRTRGAPYWRVQSTRSRLTMSENNGLLSQLIMQAYYYTRRSFDDAVRDYGITAAQMGVLHRIADHPGITGAEI